MPLIKSKSPEAFKSNVKTLMGEVGKSPHVQSREQALAIAYATKRRGRAMGGTAPKISIPKPLAAFKPPTASPPFFVRNEARGLGFSRPNLSALKAAGGPAGLAPFTPPSTNPSWQTRAEARGLAHTGPILSAVPGRTDNHEMKVPSGAYVVPAETVSHLGQSNTLAGMRVLNNLFGPIITFCNPGRSAIHVILNNFTRIITVLVPHSQLATLAHKVKTRLLDHWCGDGSRLALLVPLLMCVHADVVAV